MVNGFLVIDKPAGMTSHDVVARVRHILKEYQVGLASPKPKAKVGHAGTLDPFATGVLLVLLGAATRLQEHVLDLPKTYVATLILGAGSTTDDRTGDITPLPNAPAVSRSQLEEILQSFVGTGEQTPPAYAAVKFRGKKLYQLARAGDLAGAKAAAGERVRAVTIHSIHLETYDYPTATITVTCGSGTYIRSLVRDVGNNLGSAAYVDTLRRTAIGAFVEQAAIKLDEVTAPNLPPYLHPMTKLISHLPSVSADEENVAKFKQGKALEWNDALPANQPIALFTTTGELCGIGSFDPATSLLSPQKVFNT